VQSGSQGRLHSFQIGPTVLMALCKDQVEESVYFSRNLLMDLSSVFFLLRPAAPLLLDRAESTDLFIEGHQVLAELLEAVELGDLLLGFAQGGGIGKGLRHGLAGHAASETELRVVSRVVAFGAVAGRLAAAAQSVEIVRHNGFLSVPQSVWAYVDVQTLRNGSKTRCCTMTKMKRFSQRRGGEWLKPAGLERNLSGC
jgi:hypothetical protein